MKKQLLIISGVVLAVAMGIMFYFISIPNNTSAAAYGSHVGNRCQGTATAEDGSTYSFDWPCSSIQEGGMVNCTEGATGAGSCSWGAYTGTQGTDVYFTAANATAFLAEGGTTDQVNAIDGIYRACLGLIASKPKAETYVCSGTGGTQCVILATGTPVAGSYCNGGAGCGGSTSASGAISMSPEFNPSNPGFGTVTLRKGSSGSGVVALQAFLNKALGASLTTDGKFGLSTEIVLKAWQSQAGLTADGVFGAQGRAGAVVYPPYDPKYIGGCNGTWVCKEPQSAGDFSTAHLECLGGVSHTRCCGLPPPCPRGGRY